VTEATMNPVAAAVTGLAIGAAFLIVLGIVSRFLYICRPNQLLVISGRRRRTEDGSLVGYRVVTGGWAMRLPIIETVERMDMRSIPIDVSINGAYTRVGIPLRVRAIAITKISSNPKVVMNAGSASWAAARAISSKWPKKPWKATCAACWPR